jgi:hypothetical protein
LASSRLAVALALELTAGTPPIPLEQRKLIRRMATENAL